MTWVLPRVYLLSVLHAWSTALVLVSKIQQAESQGEYDTKANALCDKPV